MEMFTNPRNDLSIACVLGRRKVKKKKVYLALTPDIDLSSGLSFLFLLSGRRTEDFLVYVLVLFALPLPPLL